MKPIVRIIAKPIKGKLSVNHCLKTNGISSALRRRLKSEGLIKINDIDANWSTLLQENDLLSIYLPSKQILKPYNFPLSILFEDDYLIAINKPAGLLMHQTSSERYKTLANALQNYYEQSNQNLDFHPIHRLDKDTSGVVLIAKNAYVQHEFSKVKKYLQKHYIAIVEKYFPAQFCSIHFPIARKSASIIERTCQIGGATAHTDIQCLAKNELASLLRLTLHTGRTHQIRVHCSALGYPLMGDDIYGGNCEYIKRQALHAYTLNFIHPITKKFINLTAPIPTDLKKLMQYLQLNTDIQKGDD